MNKIYNKHILRNSLIPIITFLGADIVSILGGAVITETIFSYNGIGKLFLESVIGEDYPLMMALTLFFSFLGLLGNLISDITYGFIDPRIRSNSGGFRMQNKSKSPFKIAFSKFIHNKIAMLSVIFLLIITIVSIIAPLIAPFPVNQQDLLNIKGEMTAQNILGTDSGGRDNFSRLLYAGRISLSIGITSTIGMLLIGITVGVISGYFGGIVDTLLMRITEFVMLFPF